MPKFSYLALDRKGSQVSDTIHADSLALAINRVRSLGYFPTSINEEKSISAEHSKQRWFSILLAGRVRSREVTRFARELADAVSSGLSLPFSLSILYDRQKPGKLKNILGQLAGDVGDGMEFSEALAKHPKTFDDLYVRLIRTGEEHGDLPIVLDMLAVFTEKRNALTEKIKRARIHMVTIALGAALFAFLILAVVVPSFAEIFGDLGGALPAPAHFLKRMSETYGSSYPMISGYIVGIIIGTALLFRIGIIRTIWHVIMLKIPIFGRTARMVGVARFTRALGTLILSGVPASVAYDIAGKAIDNRAIARAVSRVHENGHKGKPVSGSLQYSGLFPPTILDMLAVGEKAGSIAPTLLMVANEYDKSVDFILGRTLRKFTYAMLAILLLIFLFVVSIITSFPTTIHPWELI